jgi:hypothetical protein
LRESLISRTLKSTVTISSQLMSIMTLAKSASMSVGFTTLKTSRRLQESKLSGLMRMVTSRNPSKIFL